MHTRSGAERQQPAGAARDVQPIGLCVAHRIAVGRGDERDHQVAAAQLPAVQHQIGRHATAGVLHRAVEAKHFAHRARQQGRVVLEALPLVGICEQRL